MVHGAHQLFRIAAAVQPEGRIIAGSRGGLEVACRLFKKPIEGKMMVTLITADHDLF